MTNMRYAQLLPPWRSRAIAIFARRRRKPKVTPTKGISSEKILRTQAVQCFSGSKAANQATSRVGSSQVAQPTHWKYKKCVFQVHNSNHLVQLTILVLHATLCG